MGKSILIVEDDPATLGMIVQALSEEGYILYTARTLAEALSRVSELSIDLILCDSLTTTPDGRYSVLNQIKAITTKPLIIVTAHSSNLYEDYKELGFAGILFKPFGLDELFAIVSAFLP